MSRWLTFYCRLSSRFFSFFGVPTEKYDYFNQGILNVESHVWGRIWIAKRKELDIRSDSDTGWEWLECWNIWICNYILFAIQIFVSCTVYDFVQPFLRDDLLMSISGLLTLFCLYHFGSRGVKSNILQQFEARLAKKLLICNNYRTSNKLNKT